MYEITQWTSTRTNVPASDGINGAVPEMARLATEPDYDDEDCIKTCRLAEKTLFRESDISNQDEVDHECSEADLKSTEFFGFDSRKAQQRIGDVPQRLHD